MLNMTNRNNTWAIVGAGGGGGVAVATSTSTTTPCIENSTIHTDLLLICNAFYLHTIFLTTAVSVH